MKTFLPLVLWPLILLLTTLDVVARPAQQSVPVYSIDRDSHYPIEIGSGMQYLEDPERELDINDVLTQTFYWQNINRRSPNFGFTSSAYWFRFNVHNLHREETEVYFELPIPFLDDVRLYQYQNQTRLDRIKVGDRFSYHERPIDHQNFIIPLTLPQGESEILIRIASDGTVEAPISIWTPRTFHAADAHHQIAQGIWIGIMVVMIIYNLFLFFFIRDISYLYYVLFVASYLLFQVSLRGYGFAYLWPDQVIWNSLAISIFIGASSFFVSMLVLSYLKLSVNSANAFRLMRALAIIAFSFMLLSFVLPYTLTIRVNSAIAAVIVLCSLCLGYLMWVKGDENAKYYCLAWTSALVGIGIQLGIKFGLIPESFWANSADQVGVALLVALLSVALANRFTLEKEMRLRAQESALKHAQLARQSQEELLRAKENANEELERKVDERTQTLQNALSQLESANDRLEILSTTDALTTLYNRGHFEKRMNLEFKRADRHRRDLSIILCDIDYFKKINDTHGHKAGDECLRNIALILKNRIIRSGDLIARYGGEEFIIMLVDTTLEDSVQIAQGLCDEIRNAVTIVDQQPIKMTASFGVSSLLQTSVKSAEQVVHHADLALYQAKNAGRNQVKIWQEGMS